jgi:hypothetical protein
LCRLDIGSTEIAFISDNGDVFFISCFLNLLGHSSELASIGCHHDIVCNNQVMLCIYSALHVITNLPLHVMCLHQTGIGVGL